jgi:F-type H+-transporting ATPase subunit gamma
MASAREMRLRIRSVENIAQVTRALQAVSASRVRKAEARVRETRPYAEKAWQVLRHLSNQPVSDQVHPFLAIPPKVKKILVIPKVKKILVILVSGDRGLAGAYNTNVMRYTLGTFREAEVPVSYIAVGRKGRDLLIRQRLDVMAEFSDLPAEPTFADVSAIGRLAMDEFVSYTDFVNLLRQIPHRKLLLPVSFEEIRIGRNEQVVQTDPTLNEGPEATYIYEPSQEALINMIVPRLTELQVYQAITESLASEHAARMVAMQNATDNAVELAGALRLEYNKARQKAITSDMLDIVGGAEALTSG